MKKIYHLIRWLTGCLIFFIASCQQKVEYNRMSDVKGDSTRAAQSNKRVNTALLTFKKLIQSGDIVTRTGNDFTSQSLRTLNRRDQTFSHCGIASIEHDTLFIYHALGGEWNPDQRLLRETFEAFTAPADNTAAGIFRFAIPDTLKLKLTGRAQELYHQKIKFDLDFDLKTDDQLYCAEFIYKSFLHASEGKIRFKHSFINDFEFVGVDDIILDSLSRKIGFLNYRLY